MRAMVLRAQAPIATLPLRLETRSIPAAGPGEIVVRVDACGVCRTDLHVVQGDLPLRRAPIVPGHQAVGRVEAGGTGTSRFVPGDRVGIAWLRWTCGTCEFCTSGRENLCERAEFTGFTADGGFADYAVVPEAFAYAIPDVFSDVDAAPLLCAGIIGYRALCLASVPAGGRLAIYGFGSSAHITIQVARARGMEVYVCTRGTAAQAQARALGAAWAGDIRDSMPYPAHGAIIFAPAGELVPLALRNLAAGGTLSLAGIYMTPVPSLDHDALFRERVVRTVTASTRTDGEALLGEAARIPIRPITTTMPLEAANAALARLERGALRGTLVLLTSAGATL
jgi:propanol-preferring alcohol dehydrogenase